METSPDPRLRRVFASFAGTFESTDDAGVGGWCIDQRRPDRALRLQIFVGGLLAGEVLCAGERHDIAALIGKPCFGGFRFEWDRCDAPTRQLLLAYLTGHPERADAPVPIRARVKNTFTWLSESHLRHTGASFPTHRALARCLECEPAVPAMTRSAIVESVEPSNNVAGPRSPVPATRLVSPLAQQLRVVAESLPRDSRVKAIAFYLPQFHPIPENDLWWGKGFTEWRNVARAQPVFEGHEQPRVPTDLGYYDLRIPEVREAQAELARAHGIHGFCYYYYWFAGKRLLEMPLDEVMRTGEPDFPFCLCWANESWSRRWDGSESDVLMEQKHGPELDIAFAQSVVPYMRDPRYIRVGERPMLVIYRADIIPDITGTISRWRQTFREEGIGEVHLVAALTFGFDRGIESGFDAEVQFPPHGLQLPDWSARVGARPGFGGRIMRYEDAARLMARTVAPDRLRYYTVMLGWDNTARKKAAGHIFHGFTLDEYERFLRATVLKTEQLYPEENRFIFINAWNEWAEGTYLEPDTLHGTGALERTARALSMPGDGGTDLLEVALRSVPGTPRRCLAAVANKVVGELIEQFGESGALAELDRPGQSLVMQSCEYHQVDGSLIWIESPTPGAPLPESMLHLTGWAISSRGACELVEVLIDGEVVAQVKPHQAREDVVEHHKALAPASGPNAFSVVVPGSALRARFENGRRELAVTVRALGRSAGCIGEAHALVGRQDLPSLLELLVERGLVDGDLAERMRDDASRTKPHLFVVHDPYPAGAQLFVLRFLDWLSARDPGFRIEILFGVTRAAAPNYDRDGADIVARFHRLGPVHFLDPTGRPENENLIEANGYRVIYLNSFASIRNLNGVPATDTPIIVHVHELQSATELLLQDNVRDVRFLPARFVACSRAVERMLIDELSVPAERISTIHAFVPEPAQHVESGTLKNAAERAASVDGIARSEGSTAVTILLVGSINWRKGAHVLGAIARRLADITAVPFRFVWVGDAGEVEAMHRLTQEFRRMGLSDCLHLPGRRDDVQHFYGSSDMLLLPSIEDPFPLVMIEAGHAGLPIVAFRGSGGAAEFVEECGGGILAPFMDVDAIAMALRRLVEDPDLRKRLGEAARASACRFSEAVLAPKLLEVIVATRMGRAATERATGLMSSAAGAATEDAEKACAA